ncbi:hypothetical protein AcW2_006301 [Taiwanofungus camphoratus]|nr:hypothetical protein AcW2_006301 [Antrodia cinnamomea]
MSPDIAAHTAEPRFSSVSPVIKRAAVTYGRRKGQAPDADTSTSTILTHSSSRASSHGLSSHGLEEELPPSSDEFDASYSSKVAYISHEDSGDEVDESESSPVKFEFSWKKKLKEVDSVYARKQMIADDEDPFHTNSSEGDIRASSHHIARDLLITSPSAEVQMHNWNTSGDPAPGLQASLQVTNNARSPSLSPVVRHGSARKQAMAHDSDSDSDVARVQSSRDFVRKLDFSTSFSRSSYNLPTSLATSPVTTQEKGKQRAVEPLDSEEEHRAPTSNSEKRIGSTKRKKTSKEKRIKPPTKKERQETQKATARIVADQSVSITRTQLKQMPLTGLWQKFENGLKPHKSPASVSDPIQPFSSSPMMGMKDATHPHRTSPLSRQEPNACSPPQHSEDAFTYTGLLGPASTVALPGAAVLSDEEEMPDVGHVLQEDEKRRAQEERRRQAARLKQLALEQQQQHARMGEVNEEDDSDLEVIDDMKAVAREEAKDRRAMTARGIKRSVGRKNQLVLAGPVRSTSALDRMKGANALSPGKSLHVLKEAAVPAFAQQTKESKEKGAVKMSQGELNKLLLHTVGKEAEKTIREKEEEWTRKGGKIKVKPGESQQDAEERTRQMLALLVSRGKSTVPAAVNVEDEDSDYQESQEGDDHSDQGADAASGLEAGVGLCGPNGIGVMDQSMSMDDVDDYEAERRLIPHRRAKRLGARLLVTIRSDDEDDQYDSPPPQPYGKILVPDTSLIVEAQPTSPSDRGETFAPNHWRSPASSEEHTEDGTDKENDMRFMFDRGEDKENTAIRVQPLLARRPSMGRTGRGLFSSDMDRRSSFSVSVEQDVDDRLPMESTPPEDHRVPLQDLPTEEVDADDPFAFPTAPRRLEFGESLTADSSKFAALNKDDKRGNEQSSGVEAVDSMQSGFSEFFGSSADPVHTESLKAVTVLKSGDLSEFFSQQTARTGCDRMRDLEQSSSLALTLDVGLQPALEVSEKLRQKADDIFEKEQGYLAEELNRRSDKKSQLYVDENGFLTQTRPSLANPELYRVRSPTQVAETSQITLVPPSSERRPLAALDFDVELDALGSQPRMRLNRRRLSPAKSDTSERRYSSSSPSPSKPKNAFDRLRQSSRVKFAKTGRKLEKSEFVQGEAEESDDDAMMGFGGLKGNDDEESDDENQDQTLAELVDDTAMDEKTLAHNAVLEKVREHQEEDDRELEKVHRDATEGKLRSKRRDRGVGFEDSESDSDDEGAKEVRRTFNKKRRIEGDSLEELENNPETAAFVREYRADLDDEEDFAILNQDEETLVGEEQSLDEEPEIVSAAEVRAQLREVAQEKAQPVFNPHDVSWMDASLDEEEILAVKEVRTSSKPAPRRPTDWDAHFELPKAPNGDDEQTRARMQTWAKAERLSRTVGGGRSMGVSAVTGHGKRKAGGGSTTGQHPHLRSSGTMRQPAKLAKTSSALSAVSTSRRGKFRD